MYLKTIKNIYLYKMLLYPSVTNLCGRSLEIGLRIDDFRNSSVSFTKFRFSLLYEISTELYQVITSINYSISILTEFYIKFINTE